MKTAFIVMASLFSIIYVAEGWGRFTNIKDSLPSLHKRSSGKLWPNVQSVLRKKFVDNDLSKRKIKKSQHYVSEY